MGFVNLLIKLAVDRTEVSRGINKGVLEWETGQKKMAAATARFAKASAVAFATAATVGVIRLAREYSKAAAEAAKMQVPLEDFLAFKEVAERTGVPISDMVDKMAELPEHIRKAVEEQKKLRSAGAQTEIAAFGQGLDRNITMGKSKGERGLGTLIAGVRAAMGGMNAVMGAFREGISGGRFGASQTLSGMRMLQIPEEFSSEQLTAALEFRLAANKERNAKAAAEEAKRLAKEKADAPQMVRGLETISTSFNPGVTALQAVGAFNPVGTVDYTKQQELMLQKKANGELEKIRAAVEKKNESLVELPP